MFLLFPDENLLVLENLAIDHKWKKATRRAWIIAENESESFAKADMRFKSFERAEDGSNL